MKYIKFYFKIRKKKKKSFTVKMVIHWNRLPRVAVDSPSLEIAKIQTQQSPEQLVLISVDPGWSKGLDL